MIRHSRFIVSLDLPDDVSTKEMEQYIRTAIACWVGGGDPSNPLWELKKDSIKVKRYFEKQKRPNPNSRTQLKKKLRNQ